MLKLRPIRHEAKNIMIVNGTKKQALPIYKIVVKSADNKASEEIEVTGANLKDLTTITRPDLRELKTKYEQTKDKAYYMASSRKYTIQLIVGDKFYSKIKPEDIFKGKPEDPIVEETTFGWVIHGGDFPDNQCMFTRETSDYERLYSLDVLGVEDRGENDQLDVMKEFHENIFRKEDGRYEVSTMDTWSQETRMEEYTKIVEDQLKDEVIEKVPETVNGSRIYYMPHKPVVKDSATTTKFRMVFDASARPPHPIV